MHDHEQPPQHPRAVVAEPGVQIVVGGDVLQMAGEGVQAEQAVGVRLVEPHAPRVAEPPAGRR